MLFRSLGYKQTEHYEGRVSIWESESVGTAINLWQTREGGTHVRHGVGLQHLCFNATSREQVDELYKLLQSESDRCRDILASLSHSPKNADDNPFAEVPISVVAELAAMPHQQNDISVTIEKYPTLRDLDNQKDQALEPNVTRSPELLHGLSTLVQNAIQFARNTVEVTIS